MPGSISELSDNLDEIIDNFRSCISERYERHCHDVATREDILFLSNEISEMLINFKFEIIDYLNLE